MNQAGERAVVYRTVAAFFGADALKRAEDYAAYRNNEWLEA